MQRLELGLLRNKESGQGALAGLTRQAFMANCHCTPGGPFGLRFEEIVLYRLSQRKNRLPGKRSRATGALEPSMKLKGT